MILTLGEICHGPWSKAPKGGILRYQSSFIRPQVSRLIDMHLAWPQDSRDETPEAQVDR